ncbi:MAG: PDZ domain-containing protein [Planctomycetes bacterium]|nr:PDZ domain-containing protein [Planctomycetota bacterium]
MIGTVWILTTMAGVPLAAPVPTGEPVPSLRRVAVPASEFDAQAWIGRLSAPDLDARERAFAELVEEAVANDAARAALKAWARETGRADLAWTARLALREVERRPGTHLRALKSFGGGAFGDLRGRFEELERQFGGLDSLFGDLQRDLDRMFQAQPDPAAPPAQGGLRRSESFRLQVGPEGVEVQVDEDVDGKRSTRTYKGRTLEEVLEANPELSERLRAQGPNAIRALPGARGWAFRGPTVVRPPWGAEFDDERWSAPARPLAPLEPGRTRTDVLGVTYTKPSEEVRQRRNLEEGVGLLVEGTQPGTIASALGVQAGDVLVALNGRALKERDDVVAVLKARAAGEPVKLELVDAKGRRHTLTWNES